MAGDVHLIVLIEPHAVFKRNGADLFMRKEITLLEALTGVNFEITHLDNHKIKVVTAPNEIISPSKNNYKYFDKILLIFIKTSDYFKRRKKCSKEKECRFIKIQCLMEIYLSNLM